MTVTLTPEERALERGEHGDAVGLAMRLVRQTAELLGAERLVPIRSAHIDGCLHHGDGGVEFAEVLVAKGGRVAVPTTLNVGALDLLHPGRVRGSAGRREMARRQMQAYLSMGCQPTWTCAPYQVGHRPALGEHVAWGESNAVAFANSVLGARTNRYGDFLDICCALTGRAPLSGLHLDAERRATVLVDATGLPGPLVRHDAFFPVLGAWLGHTVGDRVAVIDGLPPETSEDQLKALGAAAASTGAVGLFHVAGLTPEAPDIATALGGGHAKPEQTIRLTPALLRASRDRLSTVSGGQVDVVAFGSPHFSLEEIDDLDRRLRGRRVALPSYVCTSRAHLRTLEDSGKAAALRSAGIEFIVDTCVVVAPILPEGRGILMTNSGKFAHYARPLIGYDTIFGSLEDCVETAVSGKLTRDASLWGVT